MIESTLLHFNFWAQIDNTWNIMGIRISFIEFLNSVPLGWSFLEGLHHGDFEVSRDVPSECARQLARGTVDVGLIPAIEYQRIPRLRILPNISISAKKEARTVLFVSRVPLTEVKKIAIDTSSRTSVALLRIFLEKFLGFQDIQYQEHPPVPERMLANFDAALIIGNPAFRVPRDQFFLHDLASEWNRFTGLPFVFAVWAVREGVDLGEKVHIFQRSKEAGLLAVPRIAKLYAPNLGLTESEVEEYILDNLDYSLDKDNLAGLSLFFDYAAELGLIPAVKPLTFYPLSSPNSRSSR